jgi:hypothetical protein
VRQTVIAVHHKVEFGTPKTANGQVLLDPLGGVTGGKQPIDTRTSSVGRSSGTPA